MSGKAMEPVIEDWVDRYEEEQDQALGELVVFLIRVRNLRVGFLCSDLSDAFDFASVCRQLGGGDSG
jgi:hypothetical protein